MKTVKEMYKYSRDNDLKLLSDFDAAFWEEYKLNHARYDKVFSRLYSSFYYIHQEEDFTIDVVQSEFSEDVYNFLLINRKKYEELYRIYNISDDDYKFDNNFSIKTTYSKDSTDSGTFNYGGKTDSVSVTETLGAREDSTNSSQNNSERTDSYNDTIGAGKTTVSSKTGKQDNSHINTVATYNDEDFYNKEKSSDLLGERVDESTENITERSNSGEKITGSESIETSSTFSKGSQSNSNSSITEKSSYVDSTSNSSNENYTMEKSGLIGNKTSTSLIKEHENYWRLYEFYNRIFSDICSEFLCI